MPVYFLVTKCDLIAGFTEFFDDLGQEARAQVWGTTFPIEADRVGPRRRSRSPRSSTRLLERLQQRVLAASERERDLQRRARASWRSRGRWRRSGPLLDELLEARLQRRRISTAQVLLRGVYFTSGTQEGTPIDRMLGAIARTFGFTGCSCAARRRAQARRISSSGCCKNVSSRSRGSRASIAACNCEKLLVQIRGLCRFARPCSVLGVLGLVVSYKANAGYIDEVGAALESLDAAKWATAL